MRLKLTHATLIVLIGFGGLFYLKYTVEEKEQQLTEMKARYLADQKALRVLKAEWAYLNSPEYLQEMAEKYLLLKPVGSKHVVSWLEEVPRRPFKRPAIALALQEKMDRGREEPVKTTALAPGRGDEP